MSKIKMTLLCLLAAIIVIIPCSISSVMAYSYDLFSTDSTSSMCPNCHKRTFVASCNGDMSIDDEYDCHEPGHSDCTFVISYSQTLYTCSECGHSETMGVHRCLAFHTCNWSFVDCCEYN